MLNRLLSVRHDLITKKSVVMTNRFLALGTKNWHTDNFSFLLTLTVLAYVFVLPSISHLNNKFLVQDYSTMLLQSYNVSRGPQHCATKFVTSYQFELPCNSCSRINQSKCNKALIEIHHLASFFSPLNMH